MSDLCASTDGSRAKQSLQSTTALFLRKKHRYNQISLANSSTARRLPVSLLIAVVFFFCGCTAAFGPGYTIEKQEIRVHFLPSPEPHILIEANYTLRNTGNQPLAELEIRLPGRRRFKF
jgi:hypothetical protein